MTDEERTFAADWDITNAISEKHGVSVVTGIYRKAQLDLVRAGRKAEREAIVEWMRNNSAEICDWSPPTIAAAIIDGEHLT